MKREGSFKVIWFPDIVPFIYLWIDIFMFGIRTNGSIIILTISTKFKSNVFVDIREIWTIQQTIYVDIWSYSAIIFTIAYFVYILFLL